MLLNCIIIDDEPLARKGLKEYMADVEFLHLSGEFDNPLKAAELLNSGDIQLLFLDIQLPKITGLDFFRSLKNAPPVVFTTAYPQYALDGFDLNALDYLVKPISFSRFLTAAMKAREYHAVRQTTATIAAGTGSDHFFIKEDGRLVKLFFDDILFVEALQNYVSVQTRSKKHMAYLTFSAIADFLPADKFIRVHKSFLIAAPRIDSIEGNIIHIGTHEIPISRNLKDEVMEKLLKGKFLKR